MVQGGWAGGWGGNRRARFPSLPLPSLAPSTRLLSLSQPGPPEPPKVNMGKGKEEVSPDNFCEGKCQCPGQVRWHAGWKMQRLRGLQMAMVYGHMLKEALNEYKALAAQGDPKTSGHDWSISVESLPKTMHRDLKPMFASRPFKCALSWSPRVGKVTGAE